MIAAVVISYGPTTATAALLSALVGQVDRVIVVDNGSAPAALALIARPDVTLIELKENTGIAHAQNVGIEKARELGASHVLLMDQDSLPAPDMVATLRVVCEANPQAAAVGPYIGQASGAHDDLVYVDRRWGPRRAGAFELEKDVVTAAFLLASGCLIPISVLAEIGPMNESYFIDHVDLEWCLRARNAGYEVLVATQAKLDHALGDEMIRLPGRRQPVHRHGPIRCYYLSRNTIFLMRSGLLKPAWKLGYLFWLTKFSAYHCLLADQRRRRAHFIFRGISDALRGRGGGYR